MTNWRKAFESDTIFNLVIRKTIDEFPGDDIEVDLEINTSAKEIHLTLEPGHEWLISYNKSRRGKLVSLGWQFRLKRKSMTRLMGGEYANWMIDASVLNRVYVNEFGSNKNNIITEVWGQAK